MAKPDDPLPELPLQGPSRRRLFFSTFMQAATVAILFNRMQETGLMDAVNSYVALHNPLSPPCGLLPHKEFLIISDRIVTPSGTYPGYLHVRGKIIAGMAVGSPTADRHRISAAILYNKPNLKLLDYGDAVVGPGLIDAHVHMNEPGREDWEGMFTATQAAAAGGITTVIDMPLNSHPCTTTVTELRHKAKIAMSHKGNKTHVNVGFWAGLVPENAHSPRVLKGLIKNGALGFKAFLSPSGINDFPNVSPEDIRAAIPVLRALDVPLLVHAELVDDEAVAAVKNLNVKKHSTWLASRPARFEQNAVKALIKILEDTKTSEKEVAAAAAALAKSRDTAAAKAAAAAGTGFKVHVVHIADTETVNLVDSARKNGLAISAETSPHYLHFASEEVADGDTRFKCAPPLRDAANKEGLISALAGGKFNSLATDHSPAPPSMKALDTGDFMAAWGGIAGLQYALPATWDVLQHGREPHRLHVLWSQYPAVLTGLSRSKGILKQGMDADIVVWDPSSYADTRKENLYHRHKMTPYEGRKLKGKVLATFVGGSQVFDSNATVVVGEEACGKTLLHRKKPRGQEW
jgi:allantoinase